MRGWGANVPTEIHELETKAMDASYKSVKNGFLGPLWTFRSIKIRTIRDHLARRTRVTHNMVDLARHMKFNLFFHAHGDCERTQSSCVQGWNWSGFLLQTWNYKSVTRWQPSLTISGLARLHMTICHRFMTLTGQWSEFRSFNLYILGISFAEFFL